jgi:hypothetical protein
LLLGSDDGGRIEWSYHLADESLDLALELIEARAVRADDDAMVTLLERAGRGQDAEARLIERCRQQPPDERAADMLSQRLATRGDHDRAATLLLDLASSTPLPDRLFDRLTQLLVTLERWSDTAERMAKRLARYEPPPPTWTPNEPSFVGLIPLVSLRADRDHGQRLRAVTIAAARSKGPSVALPFAWAVTNETVGESDEEPYDLVRDRAGEFRGFSERPFWTSLRPPIDDGLDEAWKAVSLRLRRWALAEASERLLTAMAAREGGWVWHEADEALKDIALPSGLRGRDVAAFLVEDGLLIGSFEDGYTVWRLASTDRDG